MLFRLVRPMQRKGSRHRYFIRRIPADVRDQAAGLRLAVPIGDTVQAVTITAKMEAIRLSLRAHDPSEVKARQAAVDAHLEKVWHALRETTPVHLTHRQATALAGELYRAWTKESERTTAVEHNGQRWQRVHSTHTAPDEWQAILDHWNSVGRDADGHDIEALEKPLGSLLDRLLLARGIRRLEPESRSVTLSAFWQALQDAFETRKRNAGGDYAPDPKANRFPEWTDTTIPIIAKALPRVSLTRLVELWWHEAKATGRNLSANAGHARSKRGLISMLLAPIVPVLR